MSTDNKGNLEPKLDLSEINDIEILKAKAQEERDERVKEAEARRQLTARAATAEAKVKELTPATEPITKKDEPQTPKPYNILTDEVAGLVLGGYKVEDVEFIMANGGKKALEDKNSYVSIAINAKREQRAAEAAASGTNNSSGSDAIFKTHTIEQLKNMKSKDLEKILPKTY